MTFRICERCKGSGEIQLMGLPIDVFPPLRCPGCKGTGLCRNPHGEHPQLQRSPPLPLIAGGGLAGFISIGDQNGGFLIRQDWLESLDPEFRDQLLTVLK